MMRPALVLLALLLLAATTDAQFPATPCTNGVLDNNETDVDCGGSFCPPCQERGICIADSDCAGDEPGCAGVQCFDMRLARRDAGIFVAYIIGTVSLMALCVLCECRDRVRNRYDAWKRRGKKEVQERKRLRAAALADEVKREEQSRNRHEAVLQAYAAKMEAALGVEADEEDTEDDESGSGQSDGEDAVAAPKRGGLRQMVSALMTSTRMVAAPDPELKTAAKKKTKNKQAADKDKQRARAALAVAADSPEEEAVRLRQVFLPRLTALHLLTKKYVGQVRRDAAIVNVASSVLKEERGTAVGKLRVLTLVLLKHGCLVNMTHDEVAHAVLETERAAALIGGVLTSGGTADKDLQALQEAVDVLEEVGATVGSPAEADFFGNASDALGWELGDPELNKLQVEVETQLETKKKRRKELETRVMLANTSFVSATNVTQQAKKKRGRGCRACCGRMLERVTPNVFLLYPYFYLVFFGGMVISGLPFLVRLLEGNLDSNAKLQDSGLLGSTFLPVPPYYNLDERPEQRLWVPLIYTVMHPALYCFCWLPVPFFRGIWRDVSLAWPGARKWIPVDDLVYFHKMTAIIIMTLLILGGVFFISALRAPCVNELDARSCLAFDPLPAPDDPDVDGTFAFNPFLNVLMLRKIVFTLWYPILPLLHWAGGPPPKYVPRFVKRYYWEIAYYGHVIVAITSLVIALISRIDVFYPAILTWGIYVLDSIREMCMRTYGTSVVVRPTFAGQEDEEDSRSSVIHTDKNGVPTAMKLLLEVPPGFKINAGQFVYLKIPELSGLQWHPFSLASGSRDDFVELHVGVIGQKQQWLRDKESGDWRMIKRPTFTYLLQQLLRKRITQMAFLDDPERQADEVAPIRARLRGPYGSTFTKCFDPHYSGAVIIGAGTGLTAALSVLREFLLRKKRGDRVPKYCWFVWSCGRTDDLLWVWDELHKLILDAVRQEVIKPGKKWSKSANMLGWLSVTIYVTRADKQLMEDFKSSKLTVAAGHNTLRRNKKTPPKPEEGAARDALDAPAAGPGEGRTVQLGRLRDMWVSTNTNVRRMALSREIHAWLAHDRHLLSASMDDKQTHIKKLLAWSRVYLDRKVSRTSKQAVCFCGPGGLAHTIASAARGIGTNIEFSADHQ